MQQRCFSARRGKGLEQGKGFPGLMEIDAGTKEAVEWIEDQEAGLSSLERVFENAWVRRRLRAIRRSGWHRR